jgi:tetratricopeptide (TPR) repeat protein
MNRIALLVAFLAAAWTSDATALTKTERDVLGWTADHDVVIAVVARGETVVDGVPQEFYVEPTEIWHLDTQRPPTRYAHGEPMGAVPAPWTSMRPEADGDRLRANIIKGVHSTRNKAGTHRFTWATAESEKRLGEQDIVCQAHTMVFLGATNPKKFFTVLEATTAGNLSRRRDEALCPRAQVTTSWTEDGAHGFVLVQLGDELKATVVAADIGPNHPAQHPFLPTQPLIADLTEGREAEAWQLMATGDYDRARGYFESAENAGGSALARALGGDRKATRVADSAFKKSKKETADVILRAAAHVAAGNGKRAAPWIDDAIAKTTDYVGMLKHAATFSLVDASIANQLAVHALSRPADDENAARPEGWVLLASGVLQLGEFSKAQESLEKIEQRTPASRAALAQVYLDRRRTKQAAEQIEILLFANPGDCRAWLLAGRSAALSGDNNAAGAAFDAAAMCDPALAEAVYYSADFARIAGNIRVAMAGFTQYLTVAPARADHMIRQLRREAARRWSKRLGHDGVILTDVSCRRGGTPETFLCTGTLRNVSAAAAEGVRAQARLKSRVLHSAELPNIAPGASAPFGLNFKAKALKDVSVRAGRGEKELRLNDTPAR